MGTMGRNRAGTQSLARQLELDFLVAWCRCGRQIEVLPPLEILRSDPEAPAGNWIGQQRGLWGDQACCLRCRIDAAPPNRRNVLAAFYSEIVEAATRASAGGKTLRPLYFPGASRGEFDRFLCSQVHQLPANWRTVPGVNPIWLAYDGRVHTFVIHETQRWRAGIEGVGLQFLPDLTGANIVIPVPNGPWSQLGKGQFDRLYREGLDLYRDPRPKAGAKPQDRELVCGEFRPQLREAIAFERSRLELDGITHHPRQEDVAASLGYSVDKLHYLLEKCGLKWDHVKRLRGRSRVLG